MIALGTQQSNSVIYMHISILHHSFSSHLGYHTTLKLPVLRSRPLLIVHFKCSSVSMSIPNSLILPSPHPYALVTINLFSKSVSLFLFYKSVNLYNFFLDLAYKWYRMIYLFDLSHLVWQSLDPSMLLQMALFYFLMVDKYSIVYTYHIFIHPSLDGHLCCFHVVAIVNSIVVNTEVYLSFWSTFFSGYMPRSGSTGSYDNHCWKQILTGLLLFGIGLHVLF